MNKDFFPKILAGLFCIIGWSKRDGVKNILTPPPSERYALCFSCVLQDDPLSKTGYVGGNSTNISAGTDQRKVGPTSGLGSKSVRKRSGKTSEEESDQDGDFQ